MEKIKKQRNPSSNAVTTGRRSGSGRIVSENYDNLVAIYVGTSSNYVFFLCFNFLIRMCGFTISE